MTKSETPGDTELLRLTAAGDEQAFTALYRRHKGVIYRFALLMSGKVNIAEEVTQEVFLGLFRNRGHYDPTRGSLVAYLCGAARNQVLRMIERERPFVQLVEEADEDEAAPPVKLIAGDDPLSNFTRKESIQLVRQAVLALPARYREVIALCDFQELSYAEAAEALNCPIGTINSRLHRGHALLLDRLMNMQGAAGILDPAPSSQGMRCFA